MVADGVEEFFDLTVPATGCYFDAQGILHHNSGKDIFAAGVDSYIPYSVVRMRNPWFHFNMPTGEPFDVVNVAQNQRQARRVFFTKLRRNLLRPCFRDILPIKNIHADEVFFYRQVPDEPQPLELIRLHSLNSQNEAAEGMNVLAYTLDEFDAFRTKEGHSNADLMLGTLTSSSRFEDLQFGLLITYTRALNGPALKVLAQCGNAPFNGENQEWWGDRASSWEVRPERKYLPVTIGGRRLWTNPIGEALIAAGKLEEAIRRKVVGERPDSEMARMWRTNREKFNEVYANKPPASIDAYIQMPLKIQEAIESALDACLQPLARVVPAVTRRVDGRSERVREWVAIQLEDIVMRPGAVYFIGADAGESGDSFGLCVSHMVPPREKGQICPECWRDRGKRLAKHYLPEALPSQETDPRFDPGLWVCDFCGKLPPYRPEHSPMLQVPFWGFARPSGQAMRQAVRDANGNEVTEQVMIRDAHGEAKWVEQVVEEEVFLPLVIEDLLIRWKPDKTNGRTVDFGNVRDTILTLARYGTIGAVRIDRWQATLMVQDLIEAGLDALAETFTNAAQMKWYGNYKNLLYLNQLWLQPEQEDNPAYAKAHIEISEVQLVNGNRIDHPEESVSGEPGCFVGETLIPLLDGRELAISALEGQEVWVYSATAEGRIVPGKARGRKTKEVDRLIEVELDSGETIRSTPDHRYMLRDGSYRRADELVVGVDRLMPIRLGKERGKRYRRVTDGQGLRREVHQVVDEALNGTAPAGIHVHHRNGLINDNRPENLERLTGEEHARIHLVENPHRLTAAAKAAWEALPEPERALRLARASACTRARHEQDPEYHRRVLEGAQRFNLSPEGRRKHSEALRKLMGSVSKDDYRKRARKRKAFRSDITPERLRELRDRPEILNAHRAGIALKCSRNTVLRVLAEMGHADWDTFRGPNHKVKSARFVALDVPVPVYDLEVDSWSNFALAAGVIVHNSKDLSDSQALSFWLSVDHEISRSMIDLGDLNPSMAAMNAQAEASARAEAFSGGVVGAILREYGVLR